MNKTIKELASNIYLHLIAILLISSQLSYAQDGLLAEYYDGHNFDTYVTNAYVGNIESYWNETPPVEGIDPHDCSIRWTGKLKPARTANYVFAAEVDDGIRVWIDGEIIINQWNLNDRGIFSGEKQLEAKKEYDIKVEYFNALREAEIKLLWDIKKPKEELSWAEYFFGEDRHYQVIHSDYFVRAEEPEPIAIKETPLPPPTKRVKKKKPQTKPKDKPVPQYQPEPKEIPQTEVKSLPSDPVKEVMTVSKAKKFIPKNVEFVRSKSEIVHSSFKALDVFAIFMKDNPEFSVMIEGHTDVVGDKDLNQALSEERAEKVSAYLIDKGIDQSRIKKAGFGGSQPLKVPVKGKFYAPNRRVVFKLERKG